MRKIVCAGLLVQVTLFCLGGATAEAQVPHLVYGEVRASDGSVPAAEQVAFEAFVQGRPAEVLTHTTIGQTGLLVESAPTRLIWMVQCADFPTPWSVGDLLVVHLRNLLTGEQASTEVILTSDPYKDAGTLPLPLHLLLLEVLWQGNGVTIRWQTVDEVDCVGFDLWRAEGEERHWSRVNEVLVAATGGIGRVAEYRYVDVAAPPNTTCHYRLEELSRNGKKATLGTVTVATSSTGPVEFRLQPGFPNPSRGRTSIRFTLARESPAQVVIVDLRGSVVKALAEGLLPCGEHQLAWDGTDEHGEKVPPGIYFCRITVEGERRVQKIVRVR